MFTHKLSDNAELGLIEPRHAEELYALIDRNRERLRPWMTFVDNATSPDAERAFAKVGLHQFADDQGFHCSIIYKGNIVGGIGMMPIDLRNRSTEIGYWLDEEAEGKGLVTASCRVILDHCFNNMQVNRVVIRTAPGNKRSQSVAHRLGARHEGTQRQSVMIQDEFLDHEVFSLIKEDWPIPPSASCGAFFTHILDDKTELGLLEPRHADELFALIDRNREYLRQWMPWVDGTKIPDDTLAYRKQSLHQFAEDGTIPAGIWHDGNLVGTIGLHSVGYKCKEIGYWIGEEYQGKGIVTAACRALINHAFNELGINRIGIRVQPSNNRSRAIPERLGFMCEGTLRQVAVNADSKFVDLVMYSLLKDDWQ
jgi:ribosomal-protein-serine acetyltransferase